MSGYGTTQKLTCINFPISRESGYLYKHRTRTGLISRIRRIILKNDAYDLVIDECNKQILLWTAIRFEDVERRIPSWTDFQILMKNQTPS